MRAAGSSTLLPKLLGPGCSTRAPLTQRGPHERVPTHSSGPGAPVVVRWNLRLRARGRLGRKREISPPNMIPRSTSRTRRPSANGLDGGGQTEMEESQFDMEGLKKAFEAGDVDGVLEFYAEDLDHIEVDEGAPPRSPRRTGADYIRSAVAGATQAGTKLRLENPVVG